MNIQKIKKIIGVEPLKLNSMSVYIVEFPHRKFAFSKFPIKVGTLVVVVDSTNYFKKYAIDKVKFVIPASEVHKKFIAEGILFPYNTVNDIEHYLKYI